VKWSHAKNYTYFVNVGQTFSWSNAAYTQRNETLLKSSRGRQ